MLTCLIWTILFMPLFGAALNGFILPKTSKTLAHSVGVLSVAISFFLSVYVFLTTQEIPSLIVKGITWIDIAKLHVGFDLVIDPLSKMMLLVITGIGTLIHIYAGAYLHEEKSLSRFFAYLNLFVFMMLVLVLGNSMLLMFVGWEGVGLCSYLLIGYWYEDTQNAQAGMKAFVVNRIGDIGFLLGMFMTFKTFGTLSFNELSEISKSSLTSLQLANIGFITLVMFVGACGKSAQLPLYVWLPDAMAGPTPVSALIHAATMVTSGIYMMTRLNGFYYLAPSTMLVVAIVGLLTALFAASIALVQRDIKKVLAYSTVSQLGFMVLACGVGAFEAGVFHLLTHACFKALLFLAAGSVIYAVHHEQDVMKMGGLSRYLPITSKVFLIGVLAIIGFPGLAGFFSKDEILLRAFLFPEIGPYLWFFACCAAACTSFYMVRLYLLTFRSGERLDHHTKEHLHETPAIMWAPLCVLAVLSVFIGYLNLPLAFAHMFHVTPLFGEFLHSVFVHENQIGFWDFLHEHPSEKLEYTLMGISTLVVFLSSGLALFLYDKGIHQKARDLATSFQRVYRLLENKYWVDELYDCLIVRPLKDVSVFLWKIFDVKWINGFIDFLGRFSLNASGLCSLQVNGNFQRSLSAMFLGFLVLVLFALA